jgi:hypothetical protein
LSDARPAPYPADTRAKGWRFEIDYEKVDQSDTWSLAAEIPMAQPALLMMWLIAWKQEPVGAFPNDENLIRAKCKIPPATWLKVRAVLMRGWWLADDGRLYHDTIVLRVEAMLVKRAKDAKRTADNRARKADAQSGHGVVTRDTPVTHTPPDREFDTKHQAPSTKKETPPKPPRKRRGAAAQGDPVLVQAETLVADGVDATVARDWLVIRKEKNLPLTETAWVDTKAEAKKAGMSIDAAIRYSVVRARGGFRAAWVVSDETPKAGAAAPPAPTATVPEAGLKAEAATQTLLASREMTPEQAAAAALAHAEFKAKTKAARKAPEPEGQPQ